jgi:hypothetical protein
MFGRCFFTFFFSAGVWRRDRLSGSFLKQQCDTFSICQLAVSEVESSIESHRAAVFYDFQHSCDPRLQRSVRDMSRVRLKAIQPFLGRSRHVMSYFSSFSVKWKSGRPVTGSIDDAQLWHVGRVLGTDLYSSSSFFIHVYSMKFNLTIFFVITVVVRNTWLLSPNQQNTQPSMC